MAISVVNSSSGGAGNGTTSVVVPHPSTVVAGNMLIMYVANKYPTNAPTTPSGWTLGLRTSGGAGAAADDSGDVYISAYYKIADGNEAGTNVTVTVTSGDTCRGFMVQYNKALILTWATPVFVGGSSNTAGTAWSATMSSDPGILGGDFCIVGSGVNGNVATFTAEALTTTGVTYGSMAERSDGGTALGQDCALVIAEFPVSSGTSSAAPVYTMTGNTTSGNCPAGASVLIRLREAATRTTVSITSQGTAAVGTTSLSVPYPATIVAGNVLVLGVSGKYPPNVPTTPTGFALASSCSTSAGSAGVDDGPVWTYVYTKTADGTESGNLAVTVTSGNSCTGRMACVAQSSGASISVAVATAMSDAEATSHSWTFSGDPGLAVDDMLVVFTGHNSDVGVNYSNMYLTSGTALLDGFEENGSGSTTNGDDCGQRRMEAYVRSGASSGAPVVTSTTSTSLSVAAVMLRFRNVAAATLHHPGHSIFRGIFPGVSPR